MPKPARVGGNGIIELRGRDQAAVVRKAEVLFENGHPAKKSAQTVGRGTPARKRPAPVKSRRAESFFSY
jgi:hypothetical protein